MVATSILGALTWAGLSFEVLGVVGKDLDVDIPFGVIVGDSWNARGLGGIILIVGWPS